MGAVDRRLRQYGSAVAMVLSIDWSPGCNNRYDRYYNLIDESAAVLSVPSWNRDTASDTLYPSSVSVSSWQSFLGRGLHTQSHSC